MTYNINNDFQTFGAQINTQVPINYNNVVSEVPQQNQNNNYYDQLITGNQGYLINNTGANIYQQNYVSPNTGAFNQQTYGINYGNKVVNINNNYANRVINYGNNNLNKNQYVNINNQYGRVNYPHEIQQNNNVNAVNYPINYLPKNHSSAKQKVIPQPNQQQQINYQKQIQINQPQSHPRIQQPYFQQPPQKHHTNQIPIQQPTNHKINEEIPKEINENSEEDIYPSTQEKMYHKLKEMKSLTVLEEEIALCEKIIAIKKKNGQDPDEWITKKELAEMQLDNTKTIIETGKMDLNEYKKMIAEELKQEQKLLSFTDMDKKPKPKELQEIKRRIQKRIEIIKKELSQKEPQEQEQQEPTKNLPQAQIIPTQPPSHPKISSAKKAIPNNQIPINQNAAYSKAQQQIPRPGAQIVQQGRRMPLNNNQNMINNQLNGRQLMNQAYPISQIPGQRSQKNVIQQPLSQYRMQPNVPKGNEEDRVKLRKYVDGLVQEYTAAQAYFKKFQKIQQENNAKQMLRTLYEAKKVVESPNYKLLKIAKLPKPISPEYIYGYSNEERTNKFKEILKEYIKQKGEVEQKTKSTIEELQKLSKRELEKVKEASKEKLEADKAQKEKFTKIIDNLKEKYKDQWTPAPEYKKKLVDEKIEKVTFEGCEYCLKLHAGKIDYDKDNIVLNAIINLGKKTIFKKQIQLKKPGDFDEEWEWKFTAEQWRILPKGFLELELDRNYWYKSEDKKGSGKIDLNRIRHNGKISGEYEIELVSGRIVPKIKFEITPILPEGKKIISTVQKERVEITLIYPPFTGKSEATSIDPLAPTPKTETPKVETTPVVEPKNVVKENKEPPQKNETKVPDVKNNEVPPENKKEDNVENNNEDNKKNNAPKLKVDKSMFSEEELEDVDVIENLNSIKVLEFKLKEIEAKIAKIDGRTPREILTKKVKINCKKKIIEQQMGDGTISPKDYMELLQNQLLHDKALATYLKEVNENDKAKVVLGRVLLLNQEIDELSKFMK